MLSQGPPALQGLTCATRPSLWTSKARWKTEDIRRLVGIAVITPQAFGHAEDVGGAFEALRELFVVEPEAGALRCLRTGLACGDIRLLGSTR